MFAQRLQTLREFIDEHGRLPKQQEKYKNVAIGDWMHTQRKKYQRGELNAKQILELKKYDALKSKTNEWQENLLQLQKFINLHKRLPNASDSFAGFAIGNWLSHQVALHKQHKLIPERVDALRELNALQSARRWTWLQSFQLLQEFVDEHEHLPLYNDTYKSYNIGMWLSNQRARYNSGKLANARVETLGAYLHIKSTWSKNMQILRKHVALYGLPNNNIRIGKWLKTQRKNYKAGKLNAYEIAALRTCAALRTWKDCVAILQNFICIHYRLPLSNEAHENFAIGAWLEKKKTKYINNNLKPELQTELKKLTVFDEIVWNQHYAALREFVVEHNRMPNVSETHGDFHIGAWLNTQRETFHKGELRPELIAKLRVLHALQTAWYESFYAIKNYLDKDPHTTNSIKMHKNIYASSWLYAQKTAFAQNKLDAAQIALLISIDAIVYTDARVNKLHEFIKHNNALPDSKSKLGIWLHSLQNIAQQRVCETVRVITRMHCAIFCTQQLWNRSVEKLRAGIHDVEVLNFIELVSIAHEKNKLSAAQVLTLHKLYPAMF